ncbi:MAG: hypothetical protein ACKOA8_17420 [Deltaproteobacteria bacterium]
MQHSRSRSHLRLVTEADRIFYEGPITRLGLWHLYPSFDYRRVLGAFVAQWVFIRVLILIGFDL